MATRVWEFQVTVQPGTLPSAPLVTPWLTEDNWWQSVELLVPPGHNGFTGIRVMKGDVPVIPYNSASFIVANNYVREFPVSDYVATADVTVQVYNQGNYPHTFYLRATISDYSQVNPSGQITTQQPLLTGGITESPDPLSPDAILGPSVTDQLVNGAVTADQVAQLSLSGAIA